MSIATLDTPAHLSATAKEIADAQSSVTANITSEETNNNKPPVDRWAFGKSIIRMENGAIRDATEAEILAESKSSPAAMVRVLGTGADLLRFDANGHYSEDVTHIRALETQEGKSAEEISAEVRQAVEDLRNKMRADIEKGVFSVNDAGQVFYQPEPSYEGEIVTAVEVAPESIGFEMNSLLIESITKKCRN